MSAEFEDKQIISEYQIEQAQRERDERKNNNNNGNGNGKKHAGGRPPSKNPKVSTVNDPRRYIPIEIKFCPHCGGNVELYSRRRRES